MRDLPPELVQMIASHLELKSLACLNQTSRTMKQWTDLPKYEKGCRKLLKELEDISERVSDSFKIMDDIRLDHPNELPDEIRDALASVVHDFRDDLSRTLRKMRPLLDGLSRQYQRGHRAAKVQAMDREIKALTKKIRTTLAKLARA